MGENGAGKSTLGKIIAGVERSDSGAISFDGASYAPADPLEAQRLGVAMIFQELDLFPNQSVAENLALGNLKLMGKRTVLTNRRLYAQAAKPWLEKVGLDIDTAVPLGSLPIAHIQLAAIARALSMDCKLIVMDEPTSALTDEATETLFGVIEKLKAGGVTVVYVSHKMDEIFRVADSIVVMRDGHYIGTRGKSETSVNEIISMMVGREFTAKPRQTGAASGEAILSVKSLCTKKLTDLSFDLHRGEILGIAGLVGAGRTRPGEALFALDTVLSGTMVLK